jgi:hypothetical protein
MERGKGEGVKGKNKHSFVKRLGMRIFAIFPKIAREPTKKGLMEIFHPVLESN